MTVTTPIQGVRAFAPVNYLGAPILVRSPDVDTGTPPAPPAPPSSLSMDEAVTRFAAASAPPAVEPKKLDQAKAPEPSDDDTTEDEELDEVASAAAPGDEAEDEPDAEDQAGDDDTEDEDAEPEPAKGKFVPLDGRVKLTDGTLTTVADLIKGSLLQPDYTRKTQELATQRREVETQSAAAKQRESHAAQMVELTTNLIRGILPPEPDPKLVMSTINGQPNPDYNPLKFLEDEKNFAAWTKHLTDLANYQQSVQQTNQVETVAERKAKSDKELGLILEKLPRLKDPAKLKAFYDETVKYGAKYGYSEQEISQIGYDHRQVVILDKAIKWDKHLAKKAATPAPAPAPQRPPVRTSGKRVTTDERQARDAGDAMNRLKSTGRLDDAVRALLATSS